MSIGIPTKLSIQLGAKSKKCCPTKRSAYHIHTDKIMHDIFFFYFSQSKKRVSVVTCKVWREFSNQQDQ